MAHDESGPPLSDIHRKMIEGEPIDRAIRRGVRDAMRRHKLLGQSVVEWRDGKVVLVPPEEIPDFPEEEDERDAEKGTG